ncbi:hypothetical protein SDC9_175003 [bioreactor metagenome]|uniref:Uncharacterized protein n=1 Tax=bioreactor metagenome TaxID=1076179 RepID=A0A645GNU2_9ZZZZ
MKDPFGHRPRAVGKNACGLLHHVDVVDALFARQSITYVFQISAHVLLPIHIIRLHAHLSRASRADARHLLRFRRAGERMFVQLLLERGRALDGKRMHSQVVRAQFDDCVTAPEHIRRRFAGQTRDEVHIDRIKPDSAREFIHPHDVRACVAPSNAQERFVVHRLRIDRDASDSVRAKHQ